MYVRAFHNFLVCHWGWVVAACCLVPGWQPLHRQIDRRDQQGVRHFQEPGSQVSQTPSRSRNVYLQVPYGPPRPDHSEKRDARQGLNQRIRMGFGFGNNDPSPVEHSYWDHELPSKTIEILAAASEQSSERRGGRRADVLPEGDEEDLAKLTRARAHADSPRLREVLPADAPVLPPTQPSPGSASAR